ncbi:MAG: T9SS type A sorting domain-containing protein, partial [Ignavibacteriae bacterium]|nr:T9SS type A sorting domain-containing protein [Ignavibacteriota bacterium]
GDYIVAGTFGRSTFERNVNAAIFTLTELGIIPISIASWRNLVLSTSYSGAMSKSKDGGESWTTMTIPSPYKINKAFLFDSLKHIIVGEFGLMMMTEDGGENWSPLDPGAQGELRDVHFTTPLDGFAIGDNGTLLRTTDGGDIWTQAIDQFNGILYSIMFPDYYTGYACGVDYTNTPTRVLYRTNDGGQSWFPVQEASGSGIFYDVFFIDWKTGFCTMDNGNILKTTDYGYTWEEIQTGRQNPLFSCYFADARRGWACGAMGTVLSTTDGGTTWNSDEPETGDDLFALELVNNNLLVGSSSGMLSREIEQPASFTFSVKERWNLISVPLTLTDYSKYSIFPSAASDAFAFDGRYYAEENLVNGKGYWLKFFYEDVIRMEGFLREQEVVEVKEGWNLIGSLSNSIPADGIQTDPEGIIESQLYGYANGDFTTTSLEPAQGYWVKVNQNGNLLLNSAPYHLTDSAGYLIEEGQQAAQQQIEKMNTLTITDKSGSRQKLYFSTIVEKSTLMKRFAMPPLPPDGAFDVRFGTGTMAECASSELQRILPLQVKSSSYPLTISWEIEQQSAHATLIIGEKRVSLSNDGSATIENENVKFFLELDRGIDPTLPTEFALQQNYPNPFNPSTVFSFQLPVSGWATLKVFNVLGEEVATIVDEVQDAGYKSVKWDATDVPSGVYFYRISAQGAGGKSFSDVKKMLLIR